MSDKPLNVTEAQEALMAGKKLYTMVTLSQAGVKYLFRHKNGLILYDNGHRAGLVNNPFATNTINSKWYIYEESEKPEVKTIDVIPELVNNYWRVVFLSDSPQSMLLSDAVNHKDFVGYVWENRNGEEIINNDCVMWRKEIYLHHIKTEGSTKEICKAVRFLVKGEK